MEVAMISAMGSMAGGTMIAGPGLTRSVGFIYTLIAISYAFNTFFSLGAFGKKIAIVKERFMDRHPFICYITGISQGT